MTVLVDMLSDPSWGPAIIPLLALVVGLIFLKKIVRLVIFMVIIGVLFFLLESQGIYVMDHIQDALNEIPFHQMYSWLLGGGDQ